MGASHGRARAWFLVHGLAIAWTLLAVPAIVVAHLDGDHVRPTQPPNYMATKPHRTVCSMPYSVIATCGTSGTTDFTGYEPEIFKKVANYLATAGHPEWAPGNWSFRCFVDESSNYDMLVEALNNGTCDVALGGITTDEIHYPNVKLTYSTYHTGRRILVHRDYPPAYWAFFRPLASEVWLLAFGSTVVVSLVLMIVEAVWCHTTRCIHSRRVGASVRARGSSISASGAGVGGSGSGGGSGADWLQNLCTLAAVGHWYGSIQWAATGLFLRGVHQLSPRSPGGRIIAAGLAFTSALLFCMYTAAASAAITVHVQLARIENLQQLRRLAVGIWEGDDRAFSGFNLENLYLLRWNTDEDAEAMLQALRDGRLDALIIDDPWVEYMASINCDLFAVGDIVLPSNMVFMLPGAASEMYVEHFDVALQTLWDQNIVEQLLTKFVRSSNQCDEPEPMSQYLSISLRDTGGIWIILAACIGAGILWNMIYYAFPHHCHPRSAPKPKGQQLSRKASSFHTPGRTPPGSGTVGNLSGSSNTLALQTVLETSAHTSRQSAGVKALQAHLGGFDTGVVTTGWPQVSVDDRITALHVRLDQLDQMLLDLPDLVGEIMDRELLMLRVEMARVIPPQIKRRALSRKCSTTGGRLSQRDSGTGARVGGGNSHRQLPQARLLRGVTVPALLGAPPGQGSLGKGGAQGGASGGKGMEEGARAGAGRAQPGATFQRESMPDMVRGEDEEEEGGHATLQRAMASQGGTPAAQGRQTGAGAGAGASGAGHPEDGAPPATTRHSEAPTAPVRKLSEPPGIWRQRMSPDGALAVAVLAPGGAAAAASVVGPTEGRALDMGPLQPPSPLGPAVFPAAFDAAFLKADAGAAPGVAQGWHGEVEGKLGLDRWLEANRSSVDWPSTETASTCFSTAVPAAIKGYPPIPAGPMNLLVGYAVGASPLKPGVGETSGAQASFGDVPGVAWVVPAAGKAASGAGLWAEGAGASDRGSGTRASDSGERPSPSGVVCGLRPDPTPPSGTPPPAPPPGPSRRGGCKASCRASCSRGGRGRAPAGAPQPPCGLTPTPAPGAIATPPALGQRPAAPPQPTHLARAMTLNLPGEFGLPMPMPGAPFLPHYPAAASAVRGQPGAAAGSLGPGAPRPAPGAALPDFSPSAGGPAAAFPVPMMQNPGTTPEELLQALRQAPLIPCPPTCKGPCASRAGPVPGAGTGLGSGAGAGTGLSRAQLAAAGGMVQPSIYPGMTREAVLDLLRAAAQGPGFKPKAHQLLCPAVCGGPCLQPVAPPVAAFPGPSPSPAGMAPAASAPKPPGNSTAQQAGACGCGSKASPSAAAGGAAQPQPLPTPLSLHPPLRQQGDEDTTTGSYPPADAPATLRVQEPVGAAAHTPLVAPGGAGQGGWQGLAVLPYPQAGPPAPHMPSVPGTLPAARVNTVSASTPGPSHPQTAQDYRPGVQGYSPGVQGYSPGVQGYPPGVRGYPLGPPVQTPGLIILPVPGMGLQQLVPISDTYYEEDEFYTDEEEDDEEPQSFEI